jgi:Mor family transcriptional regulator
MFYKGQPLPTEPQSRKTPKKAERNRQIQAQYAEGIPVPQLAKEYGISEQRVHQILQMKLD